MYNDTEYFLEYLKNKIFDNIAIPASLLDSDSDTVNLEETTDNAFDIL